MSGKTILEKNNLLFNNRIDYSDLPLEDYKNKLFKYDGYVIIKNFISEDDAIYLKNRLVKNKHCFKKNSKSGNRRLYYYPNSPYDIPLYIKSIYTEISLLKNLIYNDHPFYLDYSKQINTDPNDINKILFFQNKHTWSSFYWYKNNESLFKHIDEYGELASFLILSKLKIDYDGGGLVFWKDDKEIYLDNKLDYGDLVFFDQASFFHEVKKIKVSDEQIGRLQFYVPTIPYGYMDKCFQFEDYPSKYFFSQDISSINKKYLTLKNFLKKQKIHHSRLNYFKDFS